MNLENIPTELRAWDQWVCATKQKRPINPRTGGPAKVNDPETWGSFEEAKNALCDKYPCIGYVLTEDDPYTFIDLDDKEKDPASEEVKQGYLEFIEKAGSYTERSVSGRGYHVIVKGTAPQSLNREHVEVYSNSRFMICTGDVVDGRTGIQDRQDLLDRLYEQMRAPEQALRPLPDSVASPQTITDLRSALNFISSDDRDTWVRMGHALKELGLVGRGLWIDWSQQSEKWQPKDARQWDGFKGDSTGYGAVFAEAQRLGWANPKSNAARVQGASTTSTIRALTFRHIGSVQPEPVQWLVEDWLAASTTAAIVGPSGTGKTFLALDMALCIATGRNWKGHPVEQGNVLYIPGEGKAGLVRRVAAWCEHHIADRRKIPLWVADTMPNLSEHSGADEILHAQLLRDAEHVESVTGQRPSLIVVDTVARALHGESDNEPKPMGTLISCMDRLREELDATVLAIHHTGHQEQKRARGWSGFGAALDSWCLLEKNAGGMLLKSKKEKDWETPQSLYFSLKPVGEGDSASCVLTDITSSEQPERSMEEKKAEGIALLRQGKSHRAVALAVGVSKNTVTSWSKELKGQ